VGRREVPRHEPADDRRHYGKYILDLGLDPAIIEVERQSRPQERAVSDDEAKVATPRNRNLNRNLH
jgi:hypothetical protein